MQHGPLPCTEPSDYLPYLAWPISEHFNSGDEGEPDEYQLYPFDTIDPAGVSPICEKGFPAVKASVLEVPRQLATISKTPSKGKSWAKKMFQQVSKDKFAQLTREMLTREMPIPFL